MPLSLQQIDLCGSVLMRVRPPPPSCRQKIAAVILELVRPFANYVVKKHGNCGHRRKVDDLKSNLTTADERRKKADYQRLAMDKKGGECSARVKMSAWGGKINWRTKTKKPFCYLGAAIYLTDSDMVRSVHKAQIATNIEELKNRFETV